MLYQQIVARDCKTNNQYPAICHEVNVLSSPGASQVWCKTRLAKNNAKGLTTKLYILVVVKFSM